MAPRKKGEATDLATLSELSEEIILEELQARYCQDEIYTYVGDILIAVNPFKPLKIYQQNIAEQYKMTTRASQTPHIYAVADSAYQAMLGIGGAHPSNQCCVISGESGAGKTESAKFFISHIISLSRGTSLLQQQILQVNPLLEAFGNAQTLMNNNSSRFGKYIQLKFQDGSVVGAKMSEYLLEKSRVVQQSKGEANFHIFYYIFAGLPMIEQDKYGLTKPESYRYLRDANASLKKVQSNQMRFNELLNAMDVVGFDDTEQQNMFTVLGAVLNMGNIAFDVAEDEGAVVQDQNGALRIAADLLGVDATKMADVLTSTTTVTRGSRIKKRLKQHQAHDVRDAAAKSLYGRLFAWIVNKVNQLLAPPGRSVQTSEIGILDIFGFEHFEYNSFEQACINLANEQLQYFFNQHIFMWEQEEYRKEGVDWTSITFSDNKPVLDLFLAKPIGLLALLDEESHFPQSTDHTFVEKLVHNCGNSKHFVKSRHAQTNRFGICHYAGKVEYDTTGFLEKNRDTLPTGLMELLQRSDNVLVSRIFTGTISRTGTLALQGRVSKGNVVVRRTRKLSNSRQKAPMKKPTLAAQFRTSLTVLMERMTVANPHFVRCIKPNTQKIADCFDVNYVKDQLRYTGVLETTRIRREGYSVRLQFDEFVTRYKLVAYDPSLPLTDASCRLILQRSGLTDWRIGKTKVFMKYWHTEKLAQQLDRVQISIVKMQKVARGFLARRLCAKLAEAARVECYRRSTFLAVVNQSAVPILSKQDELLDMDNTRKKDILQNATMSYVGLDFSAKEDEDFPPPPEEALSLPPKTGRPSLSSLDDVEFEDDFLEEDDEVVEDVFVKKPGREEQQFGAVGSKQAAVQWFKQTQAPRGAVQQEGGMLCEWFHGIITRRQSEDLLSNKQPGCFLIRVSESRFGYTLSFRAQSRCKHYMIDQTRSGKFIIVGFPRVYKTLQQLTEVHIKEPVNAEGDLLTVPCGQRSEEEADYVELFSDYVKIRKREPSPPRLPPRPAKRSDGSMPPPPLPARNYLTGARRDGRS